MRRMTDVMASGLKWTQSSGSEKAYQLHAGSGDLVGTLGFRSVFGSYATAETAEGRWTFKRVGIWRTHVTVRSPDSAEDLAVFREKTWEGGGTLEFPDGRRLAGSTNSWLTRYAFQTEAGDALVTFNVGGVFRDSAKVTIDPSATGRSELPILVTLGWYLAVLMQIDVALVVAATS